jgi:HEAT repeat protein
MVPDGVKGDAVFPMTLADSVTPWEGLLRIAKSTEASSSTRQSALFWLGQVAGAAATEHLEAVAMSDADRKLRDQAVFALSQLRNGEGVPALLRLARTNDDPKVRKNAFFWLGQSKDPRALALFEEVLLRP